MSLKQSSNVVGSALAATVSVAISGILLTRWLPPSERGTVVLVMSFASLWATAATMGVATKLRRLVAQGKSVTVKKLLLRFVIFGSLSALAACLLFNERLSWHLSALELGIAALCTGVSTAGVLLRECLYGLGAFRSASFSIVIASAVQVCTMAVLAWTGALNTTSALLSLAASWVLGSLLQAAYFRQRKSHPENSGAPISGTDWNLVSLPAAFALVSAQFIQGGDRVIVGSVLGSADVAFYAVAATLATLPLLISTPMSQLIQSKTSRGLDQRRTIFFVVVMVTLLSAVMWLMASKIVLVLFGAPYLESVKPLRILLMATPALALYFIDQSKRLGAGMYRSASLIAAIVTAGSVLGIVFASHSFGLPGATVASAAALILGATVAYLIPGGIRSLPQPY